MKLGGYITRESTQFRPGVHDARNWSIHLERRDD